MARSKYTVAVLLALLAIVATLQPSEARVQPAAAANQEEATATTTADGGSPSLPSLPLPQSPVCPAYHRYSAPFSRHCPRSPACRRCSGRSLVVHRAPLHPLHCLASHTSHFPPARQARRRQRSASHH